MKLLCDSQLIKLAEKDVRFLPIVEVAWKDAAVDGGWRPAVDHRKSGLVHCLSVGWLTKNTRNEIQLVQSLADTGKVGDPITIPKSWMLSYRVLKK